MAKNTNQNTIPDTPRKEAKLKFDPVREFDNVPNTLNLRPSQSSDVLGCSLPTYYRWAKQGRLRIIKVGPGVSGTPAGDIRKLLAGA